MSECCGTIADSQGNCGECHDPCAFIEMDSVEWIDGTASRIDRGLIVGTFAAAA